MQQQNSLSSSAPVEAAHSAMPPQIIWAVRCLIAFVVLNLIVIGLLLTHGGEIAATIQQSNPSWSPGQVAAFASSIVIGSSSVHLIFTALTVWLAFMIRRGRRWARLVVTLVLLLNLVIGIFVFVSPIAGTTQQVVNVISALLKLTSIGLLWFPQPSRAYFAQSKRLAS